MSCVQEKGAHGMGMTPPPPGPPAPGPLGYSSGLEVSKVPTAEEIQMTWSLLALGLELGGRSGKSAVFSLVGNKLE